MRCQICKGTNMVYYDTITLSNGKTYKIYKCQDCGYMKRVPC